MNSCYYKIKISHTRIKPRKNSFTYSIYMMYLDLDEIEKLDKNFLFFSYNKWNVFSFFDKDHFKFIHTKSKIAEIISKEKINYQAKNYFGKDTKERIKVIIKESKQDFELGKVYVLTNLRNFGYIFNPVSFYFCFDKAGKFRAMFSEVNNTFHDQKMYVNIIEDSEKEKFSFSQNKNFYISPFTDYKNKLHWKFSLPSDKLNMTVNSVKGDNNELVTSLVGEKREIKKFTFLYLQMRYPMITFMIIFRIHFQALKLWLKKVPFRDKAKTDKKIFSKIKQKK